MVWPEDGLRSLSQQEQYLDFPEPQVKLHGPRKDFQGLLKVLKLFTAVGRTGQGNLVTQLTGASACPRRDSFY